MIEIAERRRGAVGAIGVLVLGVAGLFGLNYAAVSSSRGQRLDEAAMNSVSAGVPTLQQLQSYLGAITIGTTALALLCCVILALLRGRFAVAVGAVTLVAGANVTTQLLKHSLFDRPDFGLTTINSYPSGHTTVAVSSVLAAVLVAPPFLRHVVIVAGAFAATLVGASTIVGGWHRPSDVLGALAVSLAWGAVVAVAVGITHQPQTDGLVRSSLLAFGGAATAGLFLIAVGVRPANGIAGFADAALILGGVGAATALTIGIYARLVPLARRGGSKIRF